MARSVDLQHGAFDFCSQMKCPMLLKHDDCIPDQCVRLDEERMRAGAIYLVRPDGDSADFLGLLPGIKLSVDNT
jgi:hypothetical protein